MSQSHFGSFLEALLNTLIGYVVSFAGQLFIYPVFGAHFTLAQNVYIGLFFMVLSLLRSYAIRRWFNLYIHRAALALAHEKDVDK